MPANIDATRILVIRAGALGDTVCATSIIEPLRIEFGSDTVIDWVAKSGMGDLFSADPRIGLVFELRNRRLPLPFNRHKAAVVNASRVRPYDYVINLELGTLFNDLVRAISAHHKIGMPYQHFAEPPETHAVENLQLIYRSLLGPEALTRATPSLHGIGKSALRQRFPLPDRYVVLVPSNSHLGKQRTLNHRAWPLSHWKTLISLLDKHDYNIVLIGGPDDRTLVNQLLPLPGNTTDLTGKTAFSELITLIENADAVITTDTGPAHISAAVKTPVTALIGPTNPKRTGPYRTSEHSVTILNANLECSPCYHTPALTTCRDNQCMHLITPEMVISALDRHD